ncbi:hypothetical protein QEN19_002587 [Hanseniaspora menglaensis]
MSLENLIKLPYKLPVGLMKFDPVSKTLTPYPNKGLLKISKLENEKNDDDEDEKHEEEDDEKHEEEDLSVLRLQWKQLPPFNSTNSNVENIDKVFIVGEQIIIPFHKLYPDVDVGSDSLLYILLFSGGDFLVFYTQDDDKKLLKDISGVSIKKALNQVDEKLMSDLKKIMKGQVY